MTTHTQACLATSAMRLARRRATQTGAAVAALAYLYASCALASFAPATASAKPAAEAFAVAIKPEPRQRSIHARRGADLAKAGGLSLTRKHTGRANRTSEPPTWTSKTVIVTARPQGYTAFDAGSATRTSTPLIDVAQSVQVLTRSLIDEQDRRTLTDALVNVSGVIPTKPEESVLVQPIVRGFPAEIYLDGLPVFGVSAAADPASLFILLPTRLTR